MDDFYQSELTRLVEGLKKQIQVYDNMCAFNPMYFKLKRFAIYIYNG